MLRLLRTMWTIRAFEEKVSELFGRREVHGLLHLSIGQEAVAAGACAALRTTDRVVSGHRPHGHAIAKGVDIASLFAELAGRETGCCRGKGGSMHLAAPTTGFVTATGIVGGNVALALGVAFACKEREKQEVAAVFFGDGAGQSGAFHESLNIAALWKLPLLFICENNGYAEFTPLSAHTPISQLARHAETYGIPSATVDGNDVLAVRTAISDAAARARAGGGPSFIECMTYRLRGHYEGDPAKYRELSELSDWKTKDPIRRFAATLVKKGTCTHEQMRAVEAEARASVEAAAQKASTGAWPSVDEVTTLVYAG
ncbi:MAG: thiamine pyrophosphate-dependent dehydrogenase E1 component subunit alpha [Alphaproteobacteria bacterium]|nr:thiamine pyrophosphate-dependent dehydrogenase E1 component subunit alpha [Alphaproteobacteria bacterium]